jgi:hypothetical protein
MDESENPPEAWQRLGRALELRRWDLGFGHRQRGKFASARGSAVSDKTLARLERGERGDYPDATLAHIEVLYGLAPGAIRAYLREIAAGGNPQLAVVEDYGTISGLTAEEKRTVLAFLEIWRSSNPGRGKRPA